VELKLGITHEDLKKVLHTIMNVVGSEISMTRYLENQFMNEVRRVDHDVVDMRDLAPYRCTNVLKANGMKMYVFCYKFGYVVSHASRDLPIIWCRVTSTPRYFHDITSTPDVLVAEIMRDGSLVYIDTLIREMSRLDKDL
jgi:hypothetical protein